MRQLRVKPRHREALKVRASGIALRRTDPQFQHLAETESREEKIKGKQPLHQMNPGSPLQLRASYFT
jgi:hypothetical protein